MSIAPRLTLRFIQYALHQNVGIFRCWSHIFWMNVGYQVRRLDKLCVRTSYAEHQTERLYIFWCGFGQHYNAFATFPWQRTLSYLADGHSDWLRFFLQKTPQGGVWSFGTASTKSKARWSSLLSVVALSVTYVSDSAGFVLLLLHFVVVFLDARTQIRNRVDTPPFRRALLRQLRFRKGWLGTYVVRCWMLKMRYEWDSIWLGGF